MKVVKFTPSYCRKNSFGSGQNSFFHNKYSPDLDIITYTFYASDPILENLSNTILKEIKFNKFLSYLKTLFVPNSILRLLKFVLLMFWTIFTLRRFLAHKPDIIHIYTLVGMPIGLILKMFHFNFVVVVSLHGTDTTRLRRFKLLQMLISKFDAVLLVSESDYDFCKKIGLKSHFIGNGYDSEIFMNKDKLRKKTILNVGSLRWQKDHRTCIKAFKASNLIEDGYELHIIGIGPDKYVLEKFVYDLNLTKHVKFYGNLLPTEVANEMNKSEIFVLSSKSEGFPKVILEALGCGLKIASTNVGGIKRRFPNECIYSPISDHKKLAYNLVHLSKVVNEDENVIKNLQKAAIKPYEWQNVARKVQGVYEVL
jgi:glycosyltransferase involved in cell wall biosynthesis